MSLACFLMKTAFTSIVSLHELQCTSQIDLHELYISTLLIHQINYTLGLNSFGASFSMGAEL